MPISRATIEFRGRELTLEAGDTQILQASLSRFASGRHIDAFRDVFRHKVRRILDVGACIGTYSILFHEVWPEAEIWAIEPSSHNFHYLMLNTGHIPQIRHIPLAAGEGTYTATIAMPTLEQKEFCNVPEGNSGIMTLFGKMDKLREDVPVVRLDDLVDWCDLIKIDVEGYEDRVIQGAARLLVTSKPTLHVEFIDANRELSGVSNDQLAGLIRGFGYRHTHSLGNDRVFTHPGRRDD